MIIGRGKNIWGNLFIYYLFNDAINSLYSVAFNDEKNSGNRIGKNVERSSWLNLR
jgi:hypothetical protein